MRRVLFVQGGVERAGAERMLYYLLKDLDREAFEPVVAVMGKGPFVEEIVDLGIPILDVGFSPRLRHAWKIPAMVARIADAIAESAPDVVHANGEKVSVFAGPAARKHAVPSIAWLHDAPKAGGLMGQLTQRALARTRPDAVVTCSAWLAEEFNRWLDMGAFPIINGLDLAALPVASDVLRTLAADLGWPPTSPIVAHFARLQRWKGTDLFLKAARKVADEIPEARFLIVGATLYGRESGYAAEIRELQVRLGLEDICAFTGFRQDALEIMASSDVVVHCSIQPDPFPTVVLEGMALGRAVVASRTRGPEEALEDGHTGLLVPPKDIGALAVAISRLIRSTELRGQLGSAARAVALERYSAVRMARQFEDLYRRLSN